MKIITIGKHMIAADQIALVEPFDPNANREFRVERDFKARLILRNCDMLLIEETPAAFAEAHGLHLLPDDQIGLNPAIAFRVEVFGSTETFQPSRPFKTRLRWKDGVGSDRNKLLLTAPKAVITALHAAGQRPAALKRSSGRPGRKANGAARPDTLRT